MNTSSGLKLAEPNILTKTVYIAILFSYGLMYYVYSLSWSVNFNWITVLDEAVRYLQMGGFLMLLFIELIIIIFIVKDLILNFRDGRLHDNGLLWKNIRYLIYFIIGAAGFFLIFSKTKIFNIPLIIYFSKELSFKSRLKTILASFTPAMLLLLVAYPSGWLNYKSYVRAYGSFSNLGLTHPNVGGRTLFLLLITWWFLYGRKHRIITYVLSAISIGINSFVFFSRTAVILTTVFVLINLLYDIRYTASLREAIDRALTSKAALIIYTLLPVIIITACILLGLFFIYVFDQSHARYFSRRFVEIIYAFRSFGLDIGVRNLADITDYHYYFDNSYAWLLFEYGVFCLAGILGYMFLSCNRIIKNRSRTLLLLCTLTFLYPVMERLWEHPLFLVCVSCMSFFVMPQYQDQNNA